MTDHVREYFDRHARAWIDRAYDDHAFPERFPVASERMRVALASVADEARDGATLVDLGCGGGQLLAHAARLGWHAVGVDIAPGMVELAREATGGLDVRLIEAGYDESGLESESADAVTALGLIEYLPDDGHLFAEATRLLRRGGRVAISCRNRLFNLVSINDHTARELAGDAALDLLDELRGLVDTADAADLRALARELGAAAADLERAVELDEREPSVGSTPQSVALEKRRQHTPAELRRSAEAFGLVEVAIFPVHPHPLPPATEQRAPRLYNRLALAWQRALEGRPLGLAHSSAFVATFEKPR